MKPSSVYTPCFPLSIFLLPGEQTLLHLFEPRYKQLLHDVLEGDKTFVIPFVLDGTVSELGCHLKITKVLRTYTEGESDIMVECTHIVRMLKLKNRLPERLYPAGIIRPLTLRVDEPLSRVLLKSFKEFEVKRGLNSEEYEYEPNTDFFSLARGLNLSSEDKYKLIKLPNKRKEGFLLNQIKYLDLLHVQEEGVFNNFYLN